MIANYAFMFWAGVMILTPCLMAYGANKQNERINK
jgi:hypothetical protein